MRYLCGRTAANCGVAIDEKQWQKIKQAYLKGGESYASLATKFKVGKRTIEQRASKENWKSLRDRDELASQAIAEELTEELAKPIPVKSVRVAMQGMDRKEIFEAAIASLHAAAPCADVKSQEAAYGQLVKIMQVEQQMQHQDRMFELERRIKESDAILKERQLNPPTVKEWAKLAVQYEYNSKELMAEVRAALRAAVGA